MIDCKDVLTMVIFTAAFGAATRYLFVHPSDLNYATYATLVATMSGVYHWICTWDSKNKDAV